MGSRIAPVLAAVGLAIAIWGLATAAMAIPEPGIDFEPPPGRVQWVLPGGPAWDSGIRSGQAVIEISAGESELDWTLHTRGSGVEYYLSLRGATAELRGMTPLALIAVATALLSATAVVRRPRPAAAFASVAGMVGAAVLMPGGHPVVSSVGGALMVALPAAWLGVVGLRSAAGRAVVVVGGGAVILVWLVARFMAPSLYEPIDALRIAASGLAAVTVAGALVNRKSLRAALDPAGIPVALDVAVLAVTAGLAISLWVIAGASPVVMATALAVVAVVYLRSRRPVVRLIDRLIFGEREARASIAAVEAERSRLARDIHDEPLQALSAAIRRLETTPDPATEAGRLREVAAQLRSVATDLHPPILEDLGLGPALGFLVGQANEQADAIPVSITLDDRTGRSPVKRLPQEVEVALLRIAQEAITNAQRHSCGSRIDVTGRLRVDLAHLEVVDDGIGLSSERAGLAEKAGRLGLRSMRGRAAAIGANLAVTGGPGSGTAVSVDWSRR